MELAKQVRAGDRLALARLLSLIENESPSGYEILSQLYAETGRAHRVGVTGAPGTGKSALVNRLTLHLRAQEKPPEVAIVAVDPTSAYTGGAILGDRVRMRELSGDEGVFIRSMANRGALGGLARTTSNVVDAMDAAGFPIIVIETVGSGQAEVDIAGAAHTVVVLEAPGMGDVVQALKAGLIEIADVLVVNKADLPGAESAARVLRAALDLIPPDADAWRPPVLMTNALEGDGVPELATSLIDHRRHLEKAGGWNERERERVLSEMERLLRQRLTAQFHNTRPDGTFESAVQRVLAREISPTDAVDELLN